MDMQPAKFGPPCFLFLMLSLTVIASTHTTTAAVASNSCSTQELISHQRSLTPPYTGQQEISFAASSKQYQTDAAQFKTSLNSGATDKWSYDANCNVSWAGATATFVVQAANGSNYGIIVSENPRADAIYSVNVVPFASAGAISSGCTNKSNGCNWAGYAVAGDSSANDQVYYVDSIWDVQAAGSPPSGYGGPCTNTNECEISQWDGLTNANGASIIQGGTNSFIYPACSSGCYFSWLAIFNDPHSFGDFCTDPSSGDEMEGVMENQLIYAGTSGNNYDMYLRDWSGSWLCTPSGTYTNPVSVSFTPYYAAFEAEREEPGTYILAYTSSMEFEECQFALSASVTGVWNFYNSGYGFGSSIYNGGYNETYPATMYHNSGTYVGYFDINYLTSKGTP
jgi:hypothetical protein